jgi:hypothetical protein
MLRIVPAIECFQQHRRSLFRRLSGIAAVLAEVGSCATVSLRSQGDRAGHNSRLDFVHGCPGAVSCKYLPSGDKLRQPFTISAERAPRSPA